jgi:hypothetical protein
LSGDTNRARQGQESAIIVADVRRFVHENEVLDIDSAELTAFYSGVLRTEWPPALRQLQCRCSPASPTLTAAFALRGTIVHKTALPIE